MSPEFLNIINEEMSKDYMVKLRSFISEERKTKYILPAPELIFNAMAICPYDRLKVVIMGERPLIEPHYDGLAFSSKEVHSPEENKSIIYDVYKDEFKNWHKSKDFPKNKIFPTNSLVAWAKQGVLLLNSVYTCPSREPEAHKQIGWESFNEALITNLNEYKIPLVFIMKCKYDYTKLIDKRKHLIIPASEDKWATKANDFIRKRNVPIREDYHKLAINWSTKDYL